MQPHFEINGFPAWWEESNDVYFTAKKTVIRSAQAVEKAQKAASENPNVDTSGVRYYPVPHLREGVEKFPTVQEWIEKRKQADIDRKMGVDDDTRVRNKIMERDRRSEERAKLKLAQQAEQ